MAAIGVLIAVLAVIVVLWAIRLAGWLAHDVAYLLLIAGILWAYALRLYHRRRMAEINELEYAKIGRFKRVHPVFRWPKYCVWCGQTFPTPKQMAIHNRVESNCSHHQLTTLAAANEALAEDQEYRLTVEDGSQRRYHGAGAEAVSGGVDSLSDRDQAGIEAADR